MIQKRIPMTDVNQRRVNICQTESKELSKNYATVSSIYSNTKDTSVVETFFRENSNNPSNASDNSVNCINLINLLDDGECKDKCKDVFMKNILPYNKDFSDIKNVVNTIEDDEFKSQIINSINMDEAFDRVYENNEKLCSRFNSISNMKRDCKFKDCEDICESLCELIDTYDMPLNKKLTISLEEALFLYEKSGVSVDRNKIVSNILEYYLRYNNVITDKDHNSLKKVLETNLFIDQNDTSSINYFFNESKLFCEKAKVQADSLEGKYKELMRDIADCKTLGAAKIIIKRAFDLICATFIIAGTVSFATVVSLIAGLFSLILIVGVTPSLIIKEIQVNCKTINTKKYNDKEKERAIKVVNYINKEIDTIEYNGINEVADLLDQTWLDVEFDPSITSAEDPEYAFNYMKDIIRESKDFADSEDVQKLINSYKADQYKSIGKFKSIIQRIYTKKPAQIIDDTPHVLTFIRNFGILCTFGIPYVGPILAIVTFCVDKYIAMGFKRKEAERVCKYFNSEKDKVEKRLDKMNEGPNKDKLEAYMQCLDKSIDKLESYRDNLYSEDELDKINGYTEAANIVASNSITIEEFYTKWKSVAEFNIDRAIQIFNNEISFYNIPCITAYEYNGEEIGKAFKQLDPKELLMLFTTSDGIINIPLFKVCPGDFEMTITDICAKMNDYIANEYSVINTTVGDYVYITFNILQKIAIDHLELKDHFTTEDTRLEMANILLCENAIDIMESISANTLVKELASNIDTLIYEDIDTISNILANTCFDKVEFIDSLKDSKEFVTDPLYTTVDNCISTLDNAPETDITTQIESAMILRYILSEAKKPESKGKVVEKVKSDIGNIANKTKDGKLAMTTNMALAGEILKKKVQNLGTKEKELSTTIDANTSTLKKSIEKSLTNNNREAIIKGSVIPSFSKIIKTGLGLGIITKINPVIGAIAAIGGLAASKALNNKERQMLLDEIDIELKVVEKEIENADRDGNTKKYRELLVYQRKLQRESQRIKYRIKVYAKDKSSLVDAKV